MKQSPIVVVILVLLGLLGPTLSMASPMPKKAFQTQMRTEGRPQQIFTHPHGVDGNASPFVIVNGDNIQSFSASGKHLHTRHTSVPVFASKSVMNSDSHNNTLFVVTTVNGSVFALAAETLKTKWEYIVDECVGLCLSNQSWYLNALVALVPLL